MTRTNSSARSPWLLLRVRRGSRYRSTGADEEPDDAPLGGRQAQEEEKKKVSSGGFDASNPFVTIVGGGGLILILFLAFVVWPSMHGGGGAGAANAANANGNPAPDVNGGSAPGVVNAAAPGSGGFPTLPPVPSHLIPENQLPPVGDLSRHESSMRKTIGLLDRLANHLASVRDANSARIAAPQINAMEQEFRQVQQELTTLPHLQAHEERALAKRMVSEMNRVVQRLRQESQRITRIRGMAMAGMQMMHGVNMMTVGLQPMIQAANSGPQPYVEVFVANVPDGDSSGYIESKLKTLADRQPSGSQARWSGPPGASSFRIWPVADARNFTNQINFGQASLNGRQITVQANVSPSDVAAFKTQQEEARSKKVADARANEDPKAPAGADAITKALFLLKSSDGFRHREGLTKLARVRPDESRTAEVVQAVEPFATGTDHFSAIEGVKALANWKNDEAVKILIHIIESSDDGFVRTEAEKQLGRLQEVAGAEAIASRITDDWPESLSALRALGPTAEPAVIPLLKSADSRTRALACEVLRDIGGQETLDTMKKLPADPDFHVRSQASTAMRVISSRVRSQGGQTATSGGASKR